MLAALAVLGLLGVPSLPGLPAPLAWQNETADWSVGEGSLVLAAGKKTDWFVWPGEGDYRPDVAPRLLFKAADDFSFSTRVEVSAHATYDAGCIAVVGSASHWAKLCLEAQPGGGLAVISVVTRAASDDASAYRVNGVSTFLKVAKSGRGLFFYASPDGRAWNIIRKFSLDVPDGLRAGFAAQSPEGEGARATFSEFHYEAGKTDLWKLR